MDLQTAFDRGFEAVKTYVDAELGALAARIAEIEARPPEKGDVGPPGPTGPPGIGEKGDTGRDGRDAADLAGLRNYVDEQIAAGLTGAFKAATITTPDNGRTWSATLGGMTHELKTAIPLDAGVWTERAYAAGDSVSHGGSLFIAQTDTSAKPGKSDDWRLAVKRGADGRDWRPENDKRLEPVRFK